MCGLVGYFQKNKEYFNKENIIKFNKLLSNFGLSWTRSQKLFCR